MRWACAVPRRYVHVCRVPRETASLAPVAAAAGAAARCACAGARFGRCKTFGCEFGTCWRGGYVTLQPRIAGTGAGWRRLSRVCESRPLSRVQIHGYTCTYSLISPHSLSAPLLTERAGTFGPVRLRRRGGARLRVGRREGRCRDGRAMADHQSLFHAYGPALVIASVAQGPVAAAAASTAPLG